MDFTKWGGPAGSALFLCIRKTTRHETNSLENTNSKQGHRHVTRHLPPGKTTVLRIHLAADDPEFRRRSDRRLRNRMTAQSNESPEQGTCVGDVSATERGRRLLGNEGKVPCSFLI